MDSALAEPPLPLGERVELPGRGTTFFRRVDGPPGAPTVVLLHGWIASGGLNWFNAFGPLSERYTVIAPDLRGHGRGSGPAGASAWPTAPTTWLRSWSTSAPDRSSRSATRWAARSPSSSGGGTRTS